MAQRAVGRRPTDMFTAILVRLSRLTGAFLAAFAAFALLATGALPPADAAAMHRCRDTGQWSDVRATGNCVAARSILTRYQAKIIEGSLDATDSYRFSHGGWSCRIRRNAWGWQCTHVRRGRVLARYAFD